MLVEHAERFGLSQLHQLRGRVGRGPHHRTASAVSIPADGPEPRAAEGADRTTEGFEIAERDLEQRGPGDFFGTRQSGMPTLRVGDLVRDHQLMEAARREAVAALDDARQAATRRRSCARAGSSVRVGESGKSAGSPPRSHRKMEKGVLFSGKKVHLFGLMLDIRHCMNEHRCEDVLGNTGPAMGVCVLEKHSPFLLSPVDLRALCE